MNFYKKYSFFINIFLAYLLVIFVTLKLSLVWIIALVTFLFMGISILFYRYDKQKHYYKNIIDNSTNIVIVSDTKKLVSANKTFFKYFKGYKNIEDFSKKHSCICEFFQDEEGYLTSINDGLSWIQYLIKNEIIYHKVKMKIDEDEYYFTISASILDKKNSLYGVIMSNITEQETYKKELELLAINDALTNIGNRRFFHQKLDEQIALTQRYNTPFSLIIFDIDFFKKVNDNYGHDVGDKVLVEYTKYISSILRDSDIFCRIGGEEFIVILSNTTKDKAYLLAQKLREGVEHSKKILPITMSFGVAGYEKGDDDISLYKRVDLALYKAKETGRNKVVLG
ncbi:GGDEF domain-containing protein [Sulfurimonas sp.]